MSAAKNAKSAKARATIAIRLLKRTKPRPRGRVLVPNFDDCFEMGDGVAVYNIVIERATSDQELLAASEASSVGQDSIPMVAGKSCRFQSMARRRFLGTIRRKPLHHAFRPHEFCGLFVGRCEGGPTTQLTTGRNNRVFIGPVSMVTQPPGSTALVERPHHGREAKK